MFTNRQWACGQDCLPGRTRLHRCCSTCTCLLICGMSCRWRTHSEVISGKGQFICGVKGCNEKDGLASYEVNFAYKEAGEAKQVCHARAC
jgi:hypothetical protein